MNWRKVETPVKHIETTTAIITIGEEKREAKISIPRVFFNDEETLLVIKMNGDYWEVSLEEVARDFFSEVLVQGNNREGVTP